MIENAELLDWKLNKINSTKFSNIWLPQALFCMLNKKLSPVHRAWKIYVLYVSSALACSNVGTSPGSCKIQRVIITIINKPRSTYITVERFKNQELQLLQVPVDSFSSSLLHHWFRPLKHKNLQLNTVYHTAKIFSPFQLIFVKQKKKYERFHSLKILLINYLF